MSNSITGFSGKYSFLSNFHKSSVEYEGILYPSSEAAFQASKTFDIEIRKQIAVMDSPGKAKKFGKTFMLRDNWDIIKVHIMEEICYLKFTQHESLKRRLLDTGDAYLEESNNWGDTFWGTCNGKGANKLGFILMNVRERLKYNTIPDSSGFEVKRKNKK